MESKIITAAMHAEHLDDDTVNSVLATFLDILDNRADG